MIARLTGAIARAFLMVMLIATPALILPGTGSNTAQVVAFFAVIAGILTLVEYASVSPGIVEFRDAPPFNRIRFISLFSMLFLLSIIVRTGPEESNIVLLIKAIGAQIGDSLDFSYSPVNLIVLMLPENAPAWQVERLRSAAGISYLVSLLSLVALLMSLKVMNWPNQKGAFNVWVNLPTFDPSIGGDVVYRLEKDSSINISLGFLLPFLMPATIKASGAIFGSVSIANDHTMIWIIAAWAFLPASLFMRGIAMGRIARMIRAQRKRSRAQSPDSGGFQPA